MDRTSSVLNSIILFLSLITSAGFRLMAQKPDSRDLEAYHMFWLAFEKSQDQVIARAQRAYQSNWKDYSFHKDRPDQQYRVDMLEKLRDSASSYRIQLGKFPKADNRSLVMLNLSQVLYLLSELEDEGAAHLEEALVLVHSLLSDFKDYAGKDRALFLAAQIYAKKGEDDKAYLYRQKLIMLPFRSVFRVFAHTGIGDELFRRQMALEAAVHYQKAIDDLEHYASDELQKFLINLHYRQAWAYYRAGSLKKLVDTSIKLLQGPHRDNDLKTLKKIIQDTFRLAGDALAELSETLDIRSYLTEGGFGKYSPEVGLQILKRFHGLPDFRKVAELSDYLLSKYSQSSLYPFFLHYKAAALEHRGAIKEALILHEKLALLLPLDSLWRSTNKNKAHLMSKVEPLAFAAAQKVAKSHYDAGTLSGSDPNFLSAASFFALLADFRPDHKKAPLWRLNRAHCYFLSQNYHEADMQYQRIVQGTEADRTVLKSAFWHLILTREILWRAILREGEQGDGYAALQPVASVLVRLKKAVNAYQDKFPSDSGAIEAFLILASAYSDSEKYDQAIEIWSRVLLLKSSMHHRSTAIRGLVFAHLKGRSPEATIQALVRLLRFENWRLMGKGLRSELLGVLSRILREESRRLSESGKPEEAGMLLFAIGREFKEIPQQAAILRDSGYFLAMNGNWQKARETAEYFLSKKFQEHKNDLLYLLAKCYEYQFNFKQAATTYLTLAKSYPGYPKTMQSLDLAERLALAEGQHLQAAQAAALRGGLEKNKEKKASLLKKATGYALQGKELKKAFGFAKDYLAAAQTPAEKLNARLLIANIMLKKGQHKKGLNLLTRIKNETRNNGPKTSNEQLIRLRTAAGILAGDELKKAFSKLVIWHNRRFLINQYKNKEILYQKIKHSYEEALSSRNLAVIYEARYKLAEVAGMFARELSQVLSASGLAKAQKSDFRKRIRFLNAYQDRLLSQNIAGSETDPPPPDGGIWYQKSLWRKSRAVPKDRVKKRNFFLPDALHFDLPYQWRP